MQASQQHLTTPRPWPRPKPIVVGYARPVAPQARQRTFVLPDVREIPRRPVAGPWEPGW